MQAHAGPRPTFQSAGPTDTSHIRPIVGPRMPMNAYAQQGAPQEGGYGGHTPPQYHTYHVQTQNNMPFTSSYGNPNYLHVAGGLGIPRFMWYRRAWYRRAVATPITWSSPHNRAKATSLKQRNSSSSNSNIYMHSMAMSIPRRLHTCSNSSHSSKLNSSNNNPNNSPTSSLRNDLQSS